jgi:hypothetical protein
MRLDCLFLAKIQPGQKLPFLAKIQPGQKQNLGCFSVNNPAETKSSPDKNCSFIRIQNPSLSFIPTPFNLPTPT